MDNQHSEKSKNITEHRYLILGRPADRLLVCLGAIIYYLYCILIPIYYASAISFPTDQDIHYTEGLFTYRESGRKHYQVGVKTENNTEFFSCKSSYFGTDLCEIDRQYRTQLEEELKKNNKPTNVILEPKIYNKWQGKPAKIGWFRQKYSLFSTDRRVIQVIVDGKEVISKENVNKRIIRGNNNWIFDIIMSSPFLILTLYLTINLIFNKKDIFYGK